MQKLKQHQLNRAKDISNQRSRIKLNIPFNKNHINQKIKRATQRIYIMMNMNWSKLQLQQGPNRNIFTNVSFICSSTKELRKNEVLILSQTPQNMRKRKHKCYPCYYLQLIRITSNGTYLFKSFSTRNPNLMYPLKHFMNT